MNLERVIDTLKTEPVRARIYAVAVLVTGYLLARGVIDVTDVDFILGAAGLILVTEGVRSKVSPAIVPGHAEDDLDI